MKNIYLFINSNSTEGLKLIKHRLKDEVEILPHLDYIYNSEKIFFDNKNTFGKFYPFNTVKLIKETNTCIHIYYIPKMFNMNEFAMVENETNKNEINKLKNKFKKFYKKCCNLYDKKNYLFSKNSDSGDLSLIEFEFDYQNLLRIKKLLSKLNKKEVEEIIYSEFLEGIIDYELNNFNHNRNIIIQKKYVKNEELFNAINSFIKIKFDKLYMSFLIEYKNNLPICSKIFYLIKEIKKISDYNNTEYFYSKSELVKLLKNKRFLDFYIENKKLFQNLELLIKNNAGLCKDSFKRQALQMDKIWEAYVEDYYKKENMLFKTQHEDIFHKININGEYILKKLRPDLLGDFVGDAKYKIANSEYFKSDFYSIDFNKILRDCLYNNKKHGILIFPKKEGVENKIEQENLNGLSEYKIEIKEIDFEYE